MHSTVIVIGAGHAGLATSRCLADRSVDHLVLERGEVANSWRAERWDSLRLLTPNWQSRLPGWSYAGPDPEGYRTMSETVRYISDYADAIQAPASTHTRVLSLRANDIGYTVETDRGIHTADAVVIATGACNIPNVPALSEGIPARVRQITPFDYRRPSDVEEGGVLVVGASATGVQIAEELARAGRQVTLSAGEHVRVPRSYRGRDIKWWMDALGLLGEGYTEFDNLQRVRGLPSLQLAGTDDGRDMDLNALSAQGVRHVGRLQMLRDGRALFSGALSNMAQLADLKMNRLLDRIDAWAAETGMDGLVEPAHRFAPTAIDPNPTLEMDLNAGHIRTVVWATGFRPDYSWLDVPVLDGKGRLKHDGGVVAAPGLYTMGLPFMRTRRSSLIDGAADDARFVAGHLAAYLDAGHRHRSTFAVAV